MIKILLVDDHQLVRTGIRSVLETERKFKVVGEADTGEQAIEMVAERTPDVVIMDINMPGMGGIEATRKLLEIEPGLKVIGLSMHHQEPYPSQFLNSGAAAYLSKDCGAEEMITAILAVNAGDRYIGREVAQHLAMNLFNGKGRTPIAELSSRELEVLMLVVKGGKIKDIADKLCISPKTVSTYRYRLYNKLGVTSDVELTRLAVHHQLV